MHTRGITTSRRRGTLRLITAMATLLLLTSAPASWAAQKPAPPVQPISGPGGSAQPWAEASIRSVPAVDGQQDRGYHIIAPTGWQGSGTAPRTLPVVVYLHGFGGALLQGQRAWLTQIARSGAYVIFPEYQTVTTDLDSFAMRDNAVRAIQHALSNTSMDTVKPDGNGLHYVGYSLGGGLAANIASQPTAFIPALPRTRSAVFVAASDSRSKILLPGTALKGFPASAPYVCLVMSQDTSPGDTGCRAIWDGTPQVTDRQYALAQDDQDYGAEDITTGHLAPTTEPVLLPVGKVDAVDWYATWKFSVGVRTCLLSGLDCSSVRGGTVQELFMGCWGNGTKVRELAVSRTGKPPATPATRARC